ncbi:MAG: hypothetical protein KKA84_00330 [Bacteroidetes bacterium]|nr:hypothetical protein [Bacteroidota bacterium]
MQNIPKISKILLLISVVSFTIWFGGYFARIVGLFQLFTSDTLEIQKSIFEGSNVILFKVLGPILSTGIISYLLFIIFFFGFFFSSKLNLKSEGWLFIVIVLVSFTMPFEMYLSYIDWEIVNLILEANFNNSLALQLVEKRFAVLGSFPIIEIFLYIVVIFLILLQPLKIKSNEN